MCPMPLSGRPKAECPQRREREEREDGQEARPEASHDCAGALARLPRCRASFGDGGDNILRQLHPTHPHILYATVASCWQQTADEQISTTMYEHGLLRLRTNSSTNETGREWSTGEAKCGKSVPVPKALPSSGELESLRLQSSKVLIDSLPKSRRSVPARGRTRRSWQSGGPWPRPQPRGAGERGAGPWISGPGDGRSHTRSYPRG